MILLNDNIFTSLPLSNEMKTTSGIVIPKTTNYNKVTIIESSDEQVVKGSVVYIPKHSGIEVSVDGTNGLIIKKRDIILIV